MGVSSQSLGYLSLFSLIAQDDGKLRTVLTDIFRIEFMINGGIVLAGDPPTRHFG